jgi:Bacterial archaeo-eukaryotic release factor family 3
MRYGPGSSGTDGEGDGEILSRCRSCDPGALLASKWSALAVSGAAGTPQLFRQISRNPFLMPKDWTSIRTQCRSRLGTTALWHAIGPHYLARLAGLVEMFRAARSKELGADDLAQVAANAATGRVGTLLIEVDRHIPGRIDAGEGGD